MNFKEIRLEKMLENTQLCENKTKFTGKTRKRKMDYKKAIRKKKIAEAVGGIQYNSIHQYSKNKIHCSCPLCAFSGKTHSDQKREISMKQKEKEFYSNEEMLILISK